MQVPEVNVNEFIEGLVAEIEGGLDAWKSRSHNHKVIRDAVARAFYMRANKDQMSDMDLVSVMLRVADWRAIADNMREDADACPAGPNVRSLDEHASDAEAEAAEAEDARAPAYDNAYSTQLCADTINETLREHGWPG